MDKYNTIQYNTVIYTYTHTYTSKYIHVHIPNIMLEFFVPAWNRLPLVTVNQHQISLLYMYRPSYVQLTVEVSFNVSVCLVHCLSASAFVYVYLLSLSKMYAIVGVPQLRIDCVISAADFGQKRQFNRTEKTHSGICTQQHTHASQQVERGGAFVDSMPFFQWVTGSNPALAAT